MSSYSVITDPHTGQVDLINGNFHESFFYITEARRKENKTHKLKFKSNLSQNNTELIIREETRLRVKNYVALTQPVRDQDMTRKQY